MSVSAARLSWTVGPADSRAIRGLFYLAEGLLGGALVSALFSTADDLLPSATVVEPWTSGLVAVFVLLVLGRLVWFYAIVRVTADQSRDSAARTHQSAMATWTRDQQWRWPLAVVAVVGTGLAAVVPDAGRHSPTIRSGSARYSSRSVAPHSANC